MLKIPGEICVEFATAKRSFCIKVVLDAKQTCGCFHKFTHILVGAFLRQQLCAVIAEIIVGESCHILALGRGVTVDDALVTLVSYILANTVLIVGTENTGTLAAILGIELHSGVECRTTASEEVENGGIWSIVAIG